MVFDMASCGGCRTCEMACSFYHTGEFKPARSSIKILERQDGLGFVVSLAEHTNGQTIACTGCSELSTPWCVQYCEKGDDLTEILGKFMGAATGSERHNLPRDQQKGERVNDRH